MPAILALFGSLIVVVLTAWVNTRTLSSQIETVNARIDANTNLLSAQIEALRSETKRGFAELELRLTKQIMELDHRVERLE